MPALSILRPVVPNTKRAARLNAMVARRMGWKQSDIKVNSERMGIPVAQVGGRDFDVFTDKKLAAKLAAKFNIRVKNKVFKGVGVCHSVRVGGPGGFGLFYQSPQEALVYAILQTPRAYLRSFL
jgi:hypothetical protein